MLCELDHILILCSVYNFFEQPMWNNDAIIIIIIIIIIIKLVNQSLLLYLLL